MARTKRWPKTLCLAVLLALAGAAQTPLAHAENADALAEKLAAMRGEVEGLSERLAESQQETRNELQALNRQKSDLQLELDREKVRLAKLRSVLDEKKKRVAAGSEQGEDLKPIYDAALVALRDYVGTSLPFRRAERLAELDQIEEQQRSGVLTYGKALVRLWSFVEDELRMSRESAAFQQTIEIDGDEKLAQVVRVGMVMLFFQTSDGGSGYTRNAGKGWTFVSSKNGDESQQIAKLFDSFKKQIRVGLFVVPNALPPVEK